jgi:hypothetical protein
MTDEDLSAALDEVERGIDRSLLKVGLLHGKKRDLNERFAGISLAVQYMHLDLEATRRENAALRKLLEDGAV